MRDTRRSKWLATAMVLALLSGPVVAFAGVDSEMSEGWEKFFDYGSCIVGLASIPPSGGVTVLPTLLNCGRVAIKYWHE